MNEYITMADGTVYENASILPLSEGRIITYWRGRTFDDVYTVLKSPENNARITAVEYGSETVYEGYTELYALQKENGMVTACLRRE